MKPNLFNNNNKIDEKWLEDIHNKTICRFLGSLNYYIYDLNECNGELEQYKDTTLPLIFSNMKIRETSEGLIIECEVDNVYAEDNYILSYYSFNNTDYPNINYI